MQQRISVNFQDNPLSDVLDEISRIGDISFSYSSRHIPVNEKVTLSFEDETLEVILDSLFMSFGIEYDLIEGKVILTRSKTEDKPKTYTISGYLKDEADGETLLGATVLIRGTSQGVITNAYGFYAITLPEGVYDLQYSFVGYEDVNLKTDLRHNLVQNVNLSVDASLLEEIIVTPGDSAIIVENMHSNAITLENSTIINKPAVLGESDLIKSLDIIPGVQLFRDGSTFFNVRGGDRDQNQILVDEAPIYNPAHLLGIFSSFMPEAIKDLKLYKGNLPAHLGGRISSVMDIKTRDGNLKKLSANGSLGLVSGRFAVEGPVRKDKSSFFVSGRRSYIQSMIRVLDPDFNTLYFTDFTAKTNVRLNQKNRLFLSTYLGKDEFSDEGGIKWENKAGTIRWNHIFGEQLFSNTTFYTSKYEYVLDNSDIIWKNHIANVSLKTDFTLYHNHRNTIRFGFKLSGHNFNPGNAVDTTGSIPVGYDFVPKRNATELSVYASNDQEIGERFLFNYGYRLSSWTNIGRTIEYEIDENYLVVDSTIYDTRDSYNEYSNLEPRLSLTYLANSKNFIKLNYTKSAQYINLISNSISPFNNLEVWLPASTNIKPQIADQVALGWFYEGKQWRFNVEGYYKSMRNQIDYINQAKLLLNAHLEAEVRQGRGKAYGIEVQLAKTKGSITGWISYAYSRSFRKIHGINNGRSYSALWDIPHQLTLNAVFNASDRSTLSGTLYLSSGAPISTPTSFYEYSGRVVPIYGSKNNDRLPRYHRFDVSWNYRLNKKEQRFDHFLTLSVFNLYGQKNSILENFNKIESENGQFRVPVNVSGERQIAPTRIFVYSIVPSITYSFRL